MRMARQLQLWTVWYRELERSSEEARERTIMDKLKARMDELGLKEGRL